MKNIYYQFEKIKKENFSLYVLAIAGIIAWGLFFYLKLAEYLHSFGVEIGKAFAG
jgi:hypothetical protein